MFTPTVALTLLPKLLQIENLYLQGIAGFTNISSGSARFPVSILCLCPADLSTCHAL